MVQQLVPTEIVLGLPYYYWVYVLVLVAGIIVIGYFWWLRTVYGTLSAYKDAWRTGDHLGIVLTGLGKIRMYTLTYIQSVLENEPMLLKWFVKMPFPLSLNGVPSAILVDHWDVMAHPNILLAIQEFIEKWNADPDNVTDQITDYDTLMAALTEKDPNEEINLPPLATVGIFEVLHYINPSSTGELDGYIQRKVNMLKPPGQDLAGMPLWLKIVTGIWVITGLLHIVMMYAPK